MQSVSVLLLILAFLVPLASSGFKTIFVFTFLTHIMVFWLCCITSELTPLNRCGVSTHHPTRNSFESFINPPLKLAVLKNFKQ